MKLDTSAIIFCDIIDNYGDAGFCIRLSKALLEYIKTVAIFTNKPSIFYKVIGEDNLTLINASTKVLSIFHNRRTSFEIPHAKNYIIFDLFETQASLRRRTLMGWLVRMIVCVNTYEDIKRKMTPGRSTRLY